MKDIEIYIEDKWIRVNLSKATLVSETKQNNPGCTVHSFEVAGYRPVQPGEMFVSNSKELTIKEIAHAPNVEIADGSYSGNRIIIVRKK